MLAQSTVLADTPGNSAPPKKGGIAKLSIISVGPLGQRRFRTASSSELDELQKLTEKHNQGVKDGSIADRESKGGENFKDIPILMPPLPGEVPPPVLYYKDSSSENSSGGGERKPVYKNLPVSFNNPSSGVEVPAGMAFDLNRLESEGEGARYSRYLSCPALEPGGQYALILVSTGKGEKRWDSEPKQLLMRLDGSYFDANQIAVLNFSPQPIKFILGKEHAMLSPHSTKMFKLNGDGKLQRCAAMAPNTTEFLMNRALPATNGMRMIYIFHEANPVLNAGIPIGMLTLDLPNTPTLTTAAEGGAAEVHAAAP